MVEIFAVVVEAGLEVGKDVIVVEVGLKVGKDVVVAKAGLDLKSVKT
jgi:hypothetical protein